MTVYGSIIWFFIHQQHIHNKQQKTHKKKREKNKHPSIIGRHIHDHIIDDDDSVLNIVVLLYFYSPF